MHRRVRESLCVLLLIVGVCAMAHAEESDEEYIPVQEMIHDFSQADYQAIAEREAALNEARAEHILAAQNRAQFETDQLTMKWQLAKAKMDAQNKLIEMQRHAREEAARQNAEALSLHAKMDVQRAEKAMQLRQAAFDRAVQDVHDNTQQQAADAWQRAAEERARAVAEAKSHQLAAEHAWQDTEIALANDAAKDATTATQRAQKTHKSLQKALNKIRQSADHRAALLQQQHALETQQLLHAANERARMDAIYAHDRAFRVHRFNDAVFQQRQEFENQQAALANQVAAQQLMYY